MFQSCLHEWRRDVPRELGDIENSGVATVQRAPVQRHVVGPLIIKQLSNAFAARNGRTMAVNPRTGQWSQTHIVSR